MITYGCSAHIMHLLAKNISLFIKQNVDVAEHFHNNHFPWSSLKTEGCSSWVFITIHSRIQWLIVLNNLLRAGLSSEKMVKKMTATILIKVSNIGLKIYVKNVLAILKVASIALDNLQKGSCLLLMLWKFGRHFKRHWRNIYQQNYVLAIKNQKDQPLIPPHFLANIFPSMDVVNLKLTEFYLFYLLNLYPAFYPPMGNSRNLIT